MLYVNGDSWSFKQVDNDFDIWPAIVAKEKNLTLLNNSVGCGSNSRIVDNLLTHQITGLSPKLIIIGLTAHHRFHIPSENFGSWSIGPIIAHNDRTGESNNSMVKTLYSKCFNELNSVYRYYRDIWQITKIAQELNARCMLFQMWDRSLSKYDLLKSNENIYNFVSKFHESNSYFYNEHVSALSNLRSLSKDWEYWEEPVGLSQEELDKTGHPNELGHKKIAAFISSKI